MFSIAGIESPYSQDASSVVQFVVGFAIHFITNYTHCVSLAAKVAAVRSASPAARPPAPASRLPRGLARLQEPSSGRSSATLAVAELLPTSVALAFQLAAADVARFLPDSGVASEAEKKNKQEKYSF